LSFLHPEFLYYMLPPLILMFGFLVTQKDSYEHYFSKEIIDKLRVSSNGLDKQGRNILFFMVGLLMILALSQPVIDDGIVEVKAKSADIMVALDISDSMLAKDVYPNRLKSAKQKALVLLRDAPKDRVGVVAFAKSSYLVSPLSFDKEAVAFLLSKLDTNSITQKGTDFLSILKVLENMGKKDTKKYLLIFSDGGDKKDFSKEISYAKEHKIVVFVLGIGTKKGVPIRLSNGEFIKYKGDIIITKLNDSIAKLATQTGGVYIQNSVSNKDVVEMLKEIESVSDKKELKSEKVHKYIQLFYYPLGLSIFILLIAMSSFNFRLKKNMVLLGAVVLLNFGSVELKAKILDFETLDKAQESYNSKDYKTSATSYLKYADAHDNSEAYYDSANAYYKDKDFKNAIKYYKKTAFVDSDKKAQTLSNLGNSYVKLGDNKSLHKAIQSYEKSLKIKEDKNTRENLEAVKKFLKKQKQKQNDAKNKKQQQKDKDKKQQKKDSHKQGKEQKKEQGKKGNKSSKKQEKMSNVEAKKWLKRLNKSNSSYLYRLDKKQKQENLDEKPW